MSVVAPSFEMWRTSEVVCAFSAQLIYPDKAAKKSTVYIVHAEQNDDVVSTTTVGPDNDLRSILHSDSTETAGDLDTITANGGSNSRYMPTSVY